VEVIATILAVVSSRSPHPVVLLTVVVPCQVVAETVHIVAAFTARDLADTLKQTLLVELRARTGPPSSSTYVAELCLAQTAAQM
jgi:hypothetical protein